MAEGELNATSVALAFVVVILAGLSTGIGAAIVFFPRFIKYATRRVLASALGISAGVMMYVSFIEIFVKSNQSFDEHLMSVYDDDDKRSGIANLYATLSFFLGVLINVVSL
jgi:ZIP family zinc transporter